MRQTSIEFLKMRIEPSKIIVVSSAYCEILHSVPKIMIPGTSLSSLTALPKISAHRMNKYGERGQPCLTPRLNVKNSKAQPLFWIQLLMSV